MSRSQADNIFAQAALAKETWDLAIQVIELFEAGELKDQKLQAKSQIVTVPEFKQQHLQPIQSLPPEFQIDKLTKVINLELSLKELKAEASTYRKLELIKKTFCRLTNSDCFEISQQKYPDYATDDNLMRFIQLDFSQSPPHAFSTFCRQAISSARSGAIQTVNQLFTCRIHYIMYGNTFVLYNT